MSQVAVEVVEDARRPEGGHAVIRLRGLNVIPSPTDYRIEPVDGLANMSETSDWPLGERHPVEARLTEQGVELIAGPDVVESPHLLPGTPVVIRVPAAGVEAEILWPDVTPLARTERRPVIALPGVMASADAPPPAVNGASKDVPAMPNGEASRTGLSSLAHKPTHGEAVKGVAAAAAAASAVAAAAATIKASEPAAEPAKPTMRARATVRRMPLQRALATSKSSETADAAKDGGAAPEPAKRIYPIQRYEPPPPPATDKGSRRLAGIAIAVAIVAALSSILGNLLRPVQPPHAMRTMDAEPRVSQALAPVQASAVKAPPSLYDIIATGAVSPRGVSAKGVSLAQALENADVRLHGPAVGRDANEGAFWLKRAVAMSMDDPRVQWALTQLGSLYAEPLQGSPDFTNARRLWEIAGGLGDPIALCFLGSLSEHGVDGPVDKPGALKWYERAKQAGGCRQIDEALKRLKQ